ncbi:unknown similar to AMEV028 [Mythimna separata entomopoxvirus 'L']|uniref:Uncharacterized protein n=1 Tax=Mythimna separata entomopoxvirus 'L' TaxID=1293572 RepID=A0A916P778_9POXV|nr:unknown similar to AMEV028 [Mythimna separata entomopoxvirus 'L']CCU56246.1 unknown similar to AMEV028 [Mythimna separata entomopoxvirus 'L']
MDLNIYISVFIIDNDKYNIINKKTIINNITAIKLKKEELNNIFYIRIYSNIGIPKYIFTNNNNFIVYNLKFINNTYEFKLSFINNINYDFIMGFYIFDILNYIKKYNPIDDILQDIYERNIYKEKFVEYAELNKKNKINYKKIRYIPYYNFNNLDNYIK